VSFVPQALHVWQQRRRCREIRDNKSPLPRGGRLAELAHGTCHYRLDGADNIGPLVVLVHGMVRNSCYLSVLASELVRLNRRVLLWDLGGRGWSSYGAALPHTPALFAGQLAELLLAIGEHDEIDLAGYSMGAPIAAKFAATFPSRVRSLVLICPAGTTAGPCLPKWLPALFSIPVLSTVLARYSLSTMDSASEWESPSGSHWDVCCQLEEATTRNEPALPHSFVNTVRHFALNASEHHFADVGKLRPKRLGVLVVCGSDDDVIPLGAAAIIQHHVPHATLHTVAGGDHALMSHVTCENTSCHSEVNPVAHTSESCLTSE